MRQMRLFDLHCDTLLEAYLQKTSLRQNGLQIDLDQAAMWEAYGQVLAVFSHDTLSPDACYAQFDRVMDYYETIKPRMDNFTPVFAVEGGKLLAGDITRLTHLYRRGVRILTLVWGEVSCMGGAFHTDVGLTSFGREVVEKCFSLGMIPDLSHASLPMTEEVIAMGEARHCPVMASHSNFRTCNPHPRNLTDAHARRISALGGVIGINLVRAHLHADPERCSAEEVVDQILYGINLCGSEAICMGCDLDGTDRLPDGIGGLGDLPYLRERLSGRLHSEDLADAVFYRNAARFLQRTIGIVCQSK